MPGQEAAPGQVPSAEQAIQAARATHGTSRPLDWSGARVELATPESVPRAGTRTARARARSTDSGTFVSARTAQTARRAAFQPMRMVVTYAQITSQIGSVLHVHYPPVFAGVVESLKFLKDLRPFPNKS